MKCAAFNSLSSVASIENQNVAFKSNRLMLRGIRMGQKLDKCEFCKIPLIPILPNTPVSSAWLATEWTTADYFNAKPSFENHAVYPQHASFKAG